MAKKVIMPKQGLQMTEGTIISWLVKEGEEARKDEPLFEMETDKLTITIDAPDSGTLLKIVRGEGETVPITEVIAIIGEPGEDYSALLESEPVFSEQKQEESVPKEDTYQEPKAAETKQGEHVFITPRAKSLAETKGIDYLNITGSGPEGLIIEKDILADAGPGVQATPLAKKVAELSQANINDIEGTGARGKITKADIMSAAALSKPLEASETCVAFTGMRKVIAERMTQSLRTAAQATHRVKADLSETVRLREAFKSAGKKVSYNDIISFAVCRALLEHPMMNSELKDDGIVLKHYVNLGIAVALDNGLIVPVIKNAHLMGLEQIGEATRQLADKAKNGQLKPDEYQGGSFTISNLGMFGLDSFVAVLNPPESGILAVGKITKTPIVTDNGEIAVRPIMELTLTYDHRVVDGAPAAQFLMRVKQYLEQPFLLLIR